MNPPPASVIVRAPNWVGDAVMSFPFFASLRATIPDAGISCLCRPNLAPLMRDLDSIDQVIPMDESQGRSGLGSIRRNADLLRGQAFEMAISLPTSFGSALMFWLADIPVRVGHAAEARRVLLTHSRHYLANGKRPHRTEGYLELLSLSFASPIVERGLKYVPKAAAIDRALSTWHQHGHLLASPVLAIAPQAAQQNKMWPGERFAEIGRRWIAEFNGAAILVGGTEDRDPCDRIRVGIGGEHIVNLAGAGDLAVTAALMARCTAFVGNDSGLAHLAAAVGLPVVVISGPGDPTEVAPFTRNAVTVKRPLFCSPCYKNECWRRDNPIECLTAITPDEVWSHLTTLALRSAPGDWQKPSPSD